jgi:TPP-dependent 2-oxoacid decarboxylase
MNSSERLKAKITDEIKSREVKRKRYRLSFVLSPFISKIYIGIEDIILMGDIVEQKNVVLTIIGVLSAFILTWRWLQIYHQSDIILMLSAAILVASLSALIISMEERVKELESRLERTERSLRVSVHGMEDVLTEQMNSSTLRIVELLETILKRMYR